MRDFPRFVLFWSGIVLLFDAIAATVSLVAAIPFGWFSVGSVAIYASAGYVGAPRMGIMKAVGGTVLVGVVDASLGWWLSAIIGPGQIQEEGTPLALVVMTGIVGAVIFGAVSSLLGGLIGLSQKKTS